MMKINYHIGEALPGMTFMNSKARRVDEINFARDYNLSADNLSLYRQATGGRLPVSCLLVPIVSTEQNLGLLVLDNFNATAAFSAEDEVLLLSLAQQVALSLDNLRLVQATQERAGQLQALNDASASLTSSLRIDQLINSLLDQLKPILPTIRQRSGCAKKIVWLSLLRAVFQMLTTTWFVHLRFRQRAFQRDGTNRSAHPRQRCARRPALPAS
jgi:hypothetical protein